jgi:hypothetical protein
VHRHQFSVRASNFGGQQQGTTHSSRCGVICMHTTVVFKPTMAGAEHFPLDAWPLGRACRAGQLSTAASAHPKRAAKTQTMPRLHTFKISISCLRLSTSSPSFTCSTCSCRMRYTLGGGVSHGLEPVFRSFCVCVWFVCLPKLVLTSLQFWLHWLCTERNSASQAKLLESTVAHCRYNAPAMGHSPQ